jgi:hypothetical protein
MAGGGGQGVDLSQLQQSLSGGANSQSGYNNYAAPNQNFMSYQGQGQPNQPQGITPGTPPPAFGATPQNQNFMSGPDVTGNMPGGNEGFDGSGSDGGVGGQPAPMQSPLQQGNKPLGMSQFQQPQGLQIQGNPTSQVVQRPQQR